MARFIHYQCPDCGGTFRHLHHPSDAPPPDRCPLCEAWVNTERPPEAVFVPQSPAIKKSAYAQAVDQTYRAMEAQSAARAEDAADMLEAQYRLDDKNEPFEGDPAILHDFRKNQLDEIKSGLKITDMKDPSQMREGDTAVVNNTASEAAKRLSVGPSGPGFQMIEGGRPANHAPGVGPSNSGDAARQAINASHPARAGAMIRAGQLGSYTPPKG